jgi:DnaJ-class molecular chaperone
VYYEIQHFFRRRQTLRVSSQQSQHRYCIIKKMDKPAVFRDYYYVLGLKPGASQPQIQQAYNELYEKFGPHVSAAELDPEAMLKAYHDITEAYEVLMDPAQRHEYDKRAEQVRQDSADLRDLWLKKAGINPADTQQAEEHPPSTPLSFVRKTGAQNSVTSGQHPALASGQHPALVSGHHPAITSGSHPAITSGQHPSYQDDAAGTYQPPFTQDDYGQEQSTPQQGGGLGQAGIGHRAHANQGNQPPENQRHYDYGDSQNGYDASRSGGHDSQQAHTPPPALALSMEIDVTVTLKEAFKGCKKTITITDPVTCSECAGMKPVARMQCTQCRGVGTYNVERYEELDLPAGLYEGLEIFKPEQGRYDVRAGRNGDLIVKIKLLKHPLLSTNGKDITCAVPVTIYEALLGAEIEAPCATGKVKMKIQPLTQPGRVYRLKGLGLGGDQLVTIEVMLPARLSADEVTAYKRLRDNYHEPNPREKYFQQQ